MFRNLKCMKNTINKGCNKREAKVIFYETSKNLNKLKVINRFLNTLKECIEDGDINKILKFKVEEIDEYKIDYENRESKRSLYCRLNPDVCAINVELDKANLERLDKEVKNKINLYNDNLSVLQNLKKHYIRNENASKNIYLKFTRDINNDLIGLYFDIERFVRDKMSNIYLFSKNAEYLYPSVLFLHYIDRPQYSVKTKRRNGDCGYALIGDFRVRDKKLGHGTFMLSNLEPILKEVNKQIRHINRNIDNDDRIINEIVAVNGMLGPGEDTTYEDLVKFYNKNGYPTYSNGYIENKHIYKEI